MNELPAPSSVQAITVRANSTRRTGQRHGIAEQQIDFNRFFKDQTGLLDFFVTLVIGHATMRYDVQGTT
jgi:hypothetical protein